MSSKTKIIVLRMKELIYTGVFIVLGILLILLLLFMFLPKKDQPQDAVPTMKYVAGVYTTSIPLNSSNLDVEVVVDGSRVRSIRFVNLNETVTTMYPLLQPALEDLAAQICSQQSLENVSYAEENQYTSKVLLDAIRTALDKATPKK